MDGSRPGPSSSTEIKSSAWSMADEMATRERAHLHALSSRFPSISSRSSLRPRISCAGETSASIAELASRVQAPHRAHETFDGRKDRASESRRCTRRCGRTGSRQVIVDLPLHPLDHLTERRREIVMARGAGLLCLLRQHREGRLQSVREISRRGEGPGDRALTILEQRVQIVHERLHFARIVAFDSLAASLAHRRQAGAKAPQRRHRSVHEEQAPHDEGSGEDSHHGVIRRTGHRELRMIPGDLEQQGSDRDKHRGHPDERSDEEARAERALHDSVPMRYPSPRTVSIVEAPSFRRRRAMNTSTVFESRSNVCA